MSDWIILRTAPRSTLRLAASLAKDGFDVWTPVEQKVVRVPRMNVRRPVTFPMLPSYVFARAAHLVDLLQLAAMPVKPRRGPGLREPAHASFSVVHWHDSIPLVADAAFTHLRRIEAKRAPIKEAARALPKGATVKVDGGSFGGMEGIVERSTSRLTDVCFNDRYVVKISTCLLNVDAVSSYQRAA